MKCNFCGHDMNEPSLLKIVCVLEADKRRSIYEIGDNDGLGSGVFTTTYRGGDDALKFSYKRAKEVESTGLVKEVVNCKGLFERVSNYVCK